MTKKQTARAFADLKEAARKAAKALAAISSKYDPGRFENARLNEPPEPEEEDDEL